MRPWLTVIIPSIGRDTLGRTLQSIRAQAPPSEVELLVIGDTHGTPLCTTYGARYLGYDGGLHCVGQPQRQYGIGQAAGAWLAWSQDDSAWTVGAWAAIAASIAREPRCPRLFQVQTWQAGVVPRLQTVKLGNCDADGIVVPNEPARLGRWANDYCGDFAFIAATVERWGGAVVFEPTIIAIGRPDVRRQFGGLRVAG
jgi:hypothetical protein